MLFNLCYFVGSLVFSTQGVRKFVVFGSTVCNCSMPELRKMLDWGPNKKKKIANYNSFHDT